MKATLYEALGILPTSSGEDVRAALRRLIRKYYAKTRDGQGNVEEALRFINHASRILSDPERRRLHDTELLRPSTESDPRQLCRAYLQRGIKAYKEKGWLEAADNFDRATKAEPTNPQAWHHLALACAQEKNWLPRAVGAIERACELEPMNPTYAKQAGRICQMSGQIDRAIHHYRRAVEWGEDDPAVQRALDELTKAPRRGGLFGKA